MLSALLLALVLRAAEAANSSADALFTNLSVSAVATLPVPWEQTVEVNAEARLEVFPADGGCLLGVNVSALANVTEGNSTTLVSVEREAWTAHVASATRAVLRCERLSAAGFELRASAVRYANASSSFAVPEGNLTVSGWNETALVRPAQVFEVSVDAWPVWPPTAVWISVEGGNGSCATATSADGPWALRTALSSPAAFVQCASPSQTPARLRAAHPLLRNWTSAAFLPGQTPSAPAWVDVAEGLGRVDVSWERGGLHGFPALEYEVREVLQLNRTWLLGNASSPLAVTGQPGGLQLRFLVRVRTAAGTSAWAAGSGWPRAGELAVGAALPSLLPYRQSRSVVVELAGEPLDVEVAVVVNTTTANCGLALENNATAWAHNRSRTLALAPNATQLQLWLRCEAASLEPAAVVASGDPWLIAGSSPSFLVGILPEPPKNVTAEPRVGEANVNWTATESYGLPILDFTVTSTYDNGSVVVDGALDSTVFKRILGDVDHYFYVTARTGVGSSAPSALTTRIRPSSFTPDPVEVFAKDVGSGSATLYWTAAADNGQPVTEYRVSTLFDCVVTQITVTTLNTTASVYDGVAYNFLVAPVNAFGAGPAASLSVLSQGAPEPAVLVAEPYGSLGNALLEWEAPFDSGAAITRFEVYINDSMHERISDTSITSLILLALDDTTSHFVFVQTYNSVGSSVSNVVELDVANAPVQRASSFSFSDTDYDVDELGGEISVRTPSDESSITHYVAYFADSTGSAVDGGFIGDTPVTGDSTVYIEMPENTRPPDDATKLLVLTRYYTAEMSVGRTVNINDKYVPYYPPGPLSFEDSFAHAGLDGFVAAEELYSSFSITSTRLFWGSSATEVISTVDTFAESSNDLVVDLPYNTSVPDGATHFIAKTRNSYGDMDTGCSSLRIVDYVCDEAPDCAALGREACTTTEHTCGACREGYAGTEGHSNDVCTPPPLFFANVTWNNTLDTDLPVETLTGGFFRADEVPAVVAAGQLTHWTAVVNGTSWTADVGFGSVDVALSSETSEESAVTSVSSYGQGVVTDYWQLARYDAEHHETRVWVFVTLRSPS